RSLCWLDLHLEMRPWNKLLRPSKKGRLSLSRLGCLDLFGSTSRNRRSEKVTVETVIAVELERRNVKMQILFAATDLHRQRGFASSENDEAQYAVSRAP
ncbi:MAG TPA: hypothetical protein VMM15_33615, partial [Bradyrhizobium sp.]|nr:hypothetical protein [Bradyrhizobium sp.]